MRLATHLSLLLLFALSVVGVFGVTSCARIVGVDFASEHLEVAEGPEASTQDSDVDTGGMCTAKTCPALGFTCGNQDDTCHGVLNCGVCGAKDVCFDGNCGCKPKTCADLSANCGTQPDGCDNTRECGSCDTSPAGPYCGGGIANQCGPNICIPLKCSGNVGPNAGLTFCGMISDGCGKVLPCGACMAPDTCGGGARKDTCGCTPATCAQGGFTCGTISDGCNGALNCGGCAAGLSCINNNCVPEECGSPQTCASLGKNCGTVGDGCGGMLNCGSCPNGTTCGGGGVANVCNVTTTLQPVGGTLTGLQPGETIVLQDNGTDFLSLTANGAFTFAKLLAPGITFAVTIKTQPSTPVQTCTVSSGSGTVGNVPVMSVVVNCAFGTYTVGGTMVGLAGSETVVLQLNGTGQSFIFSNGTFTFPTPLADGAMYAVTVKANPATPISQTCTPTKATGSVMGANVTSVVVTCVANAFTVGGSVTGLAIGDSIVLKDNGGDSLTVMANGAFAFATKVTSGLPYSVTLVANPRVPVKQLCLVSNGAGPVGATNVITVVVTCTGPFTVGGVIHGLAAGDSLRLIDANTGGPVFNGTASGTGTDNFTSPATYGPPDTYNIVVGSQPSGPTNQQCTVATGSGSITNANITNVSVTCVKSYYINGTVYGLPCGVGVYLYDGDNGSNIANVYGNCSGSDNFTSQAVYVPGQNYNAYVGNSDQQVQCNVTAGDNGAEGVGNGTQSGGPIEVSCNQRYPLYFQVYGLNAYDELYLYDNYSGNQVCYVYQNNYGGQEVDCSSDSNGVFYNPGDSYNISVNECCSGQQCDVNDPYGGTQSNGTNYISINCNGGNGSGCTPQYNYCNYGSDCCSGNCYGNSCACGDYNTYCYQDQDCCSGYCNGNSCN